MAGALTGAVTVAVAGIGFARSTAPEATSLTELVFEAASAALADAGLSRADLDGVCLAASDQLDGRAISSMQLAGPSGAYLKDEIKVGDDGSLAYATAVLRIEAGVDRRVLAVSWDRQVLLGSPCPGCARVLVPPRSFCEDCFVATSDDWVEVGPEGVVEAFTFTYAAFAGYAEPPYGVVYVRPDGATTALGNLVGGVDLSDAAAAARGLAIGTRMRAVFRPDRQARITDFRWEPAG